MQGRTDKQDVSCQLRPQWLESLIIHVIRRALTRGTNNSASKCALNVAVGRSLGMEIGIARVWQSVGAFDPVLTRKQRKKERKEKEKKKKKKKKKRLHEDDSFFIMTKSGIF